MLLSSIFSSTLCKPSFRSDNNSNNVISSCKKKTKISFIVVCAFSYKKFIHFALDETKRHTHLVPSALEATDAKTKMQLLSFRAPKIRLFRSLYIEGPNSMQVLDFAVFPEPSKDLPIFCANFFTSLSANIIVLDLNPLYNVINGSDYKEKYYESLIPLGLKYAELLPWGGKLTSESLEFFSPIVIWTKFAPSECKYNILYSAFIDYLKAWLDLMEDTTEEADASQIVSNTEAQHRYLTWRAEKDPGHVLLSKLFGKTLTKELIRGFLFDGIEEMGRKKFLDYFPEYGCEDGSVSEKRSMVGKSFEHRPWNTQVAPHACLGALGEEAHILSLGLIQSGRII